MAAGREGTDRCGGDGAGRGRIRGGASRRDLPKPIVPLAAAALRGYADQACVPAGGRCAWARSGTRSADDTGGCRDRVCERNEDVAPGVGRGLNHQGADLSSPRGAMGGPIDANLSAHGTPNWMNQPAGRCMRPEPLQACRCTVRLRDQARPRARADLHCEGS